MIWFDQDDQTKTPALETKPIPRSIREPGCLALADVILERRVPAAATLLLERALLTQVAVQNQENQAIWPSWFSELQEIETGQMLKPTKTRTVHAVVGRFSRTAVDNGECRLFY